MLGIKSTMRRAALVASLGAMLAAGAAPAGAATPDPDRTSTDLTGWNWLTYATAGQVSALLNQGNRLVDLEVAKASPLRFTVATVVNQGSYARAAGWYYGQSAAALQSKVAQQGGRITDVEAYVRDGKLRFAATFVKNSGEAAKNWHWFYGLSSGQVAAKLSEHKSRLIDIESYVSGGKRRYVVVMIRNDGVDGAGWGWFPGATLSEIQAWNTKHGQRTLDLEPIGGNKFAAVTVQGTPFNAFEFSMNAKRAGDFISQNAIRITDIETYTRDGKRLFYVHGVNNTDEFNAAVRSKARLWDKARQGQWGMWVKQVGGPVLVALGSDRSFEGASVLKILHHTYLHHRLDINQDSLTNSFAFPDCPPASSGRGPDCQRWMVTEPGAPIPGNICPAADEPHVQTQGTLDFQDRVMMRNSDNRTTMGIEQRYGRATLNNYARNVIKTTGTVINHNIGCAQPPNRMLLTDLSKMIEGVDNGTLVANPVWRERYFATMTQADGVSTPLRALITEEANRVGKGAVVPAFVNLVDYKGKGGSYGTTISASAGFGRVVLPFKADGSQQVSFSYGHYLNCSNGCLDGDDTTRARRNASYGAAATEKFRPAIRAALVGW